MADKTPLRVLVGIDTSDNSENAFDYYMKNLHRKENELVLLHVAEIPQATFMSGAVWDEVVQQEKERSLLVEKEFKEKLKTLGASGRILVTFGNRPGETIIETANEEKVNMIVVGSRGQGKLRRTILGSVSDYVLHHAHCAVVVCRYEHEHHHHHHHHHFGFHLPGHHHHDKDKNHHDKDKNHHDEDKPHQEKERNSSDSDKSEK